MSPKYPKCSFGISANLLNFQASWIECFLKTISKASQLECFFDDVHILQKCSPCGLDAQRKSTYGHKLPIMF